MNLLKHDNVHTDIPGKRRTTGGRGMKIEHSVDKNQEIYDRYGISGSNHFGETEELCEVVRALEIVRDKLRQELQKVKTDRAGWAARSKADFDRLGAALEPLRRKRPTGEPACSDGEAVEELVAKYDRLKEENAELLSKLDTMDVSYNMLNRKYNQVRKVLEKIAVMPLSSSWRQHFYDAVGMAQDELKENY